MTYASRPLAFLVSACVFLSFAAATGAAATGHAQDLETAKQQLASGDHDQIEVGIQGLGMIGSAEAVVPILERIRAGLPPDLLETAIITLMALGQSHAGPVLFDLAAHRRPEIRVRAIEAIVAVGPNGADAALRKALSDGDPKVRSAGAVGLGELKSADSVDLLFQALDKGNLEASTSIGKILKPEQAPRLLAYLGKIPFRSLSPALAEILTRKDISDREKLTVIARLQDVGTPEVKNYLGDLLRASGESMSQAVSRAILKAMQEIAN